MKKENHAKSPAIIKVSLLKKYEYKVQRKDKKINIPDKFCIKHTFYIKQAKDIDQKQ